MLAPQAGDLAAVSIYFVFKRIPRREKSCILKSRTLSLAGNQMEAPCLQELLWLLSQRPLFSGSDCLAGASGLSQSLPAISEESTFKNIWLSSFCCGPSWKIMAFVRTPRWWLSDSQPQPHSGSGSHQAILRSLKCPRLLDLPCSSLSPDYRDKPLGTHQRA